MKQYFNLNCRGDSIVVGMCLPLSVKNEEVRRLFRLNVDIVEASSLEDLKSSADKNLFFDRNSSIVYRKFSEDRERSDADKVFT